VTVTEIRKYNPSKDQRVLEFHLDRTHVHIGSVGMSTLLDQGTFNNLFLPDGLWLAVEGEATVGDLPPTNRSKLRV